MLKYIIILLITLLCSILYNGAIAAEPRFIFDATKNADDVRIQNIHQMVLKCNNEDLYINDLINNVVILHFWASWCPECNDEMKELDKLSKRLDDVIILPISMNFKDFEKIQQYYDEHEITNLKMCADSKWSLFKALNLVNVPTSIIIDKNGAEYARYNKSIKWGLYSLEDLININ